MLSLYIHIPFCVKKCPYCGFYSTEYSREQADTFVTALQREAEIHKNSFRETDVDTVYIGGGTPTTLSLEQLERIMIILREHFRIENAIEFTVEANPNAITDQMLELLLKHGVNRVSIGVQSFSNATLRSLGRAHSSEEARDAVRMARTAGFTNVGIDLMYGVPRQELRDWRKDIETVVDLQPEHISAYGVSLDDGTLFTQCAEAGTLSLPDDQTVLEMSKAAVKAFTDAGYGHYAISNFSLPGFACRHNVNYWKRGAYLGLGPSAWSFLSGKRYRNCADVNTYCSRIQGGLSPVAYEEQVTPDQAALESIMLGVRTEQGIDLRAFCNDHGTQERDRLIKNSEDLVQSGLVRLTSGSLNLTESGVHLSDSVIGRLAT